MPGDIPADASPGLRRFAELLLRWNRSINLVGRGDEARLWRRHIADSLQLRALLEEMPPRAIDLGSGAGFPGLVLAIECGAHFDLIEQDQAKAAFLREAGRVTGAPVTVHATKIEAAVLPPAPLITARGLAPLPKLLSYAQRLLTPDGVCLFLKGRGVGTEVSEAMRDWTMRVERIPSTTDPSGVILRITGLAHNGHSRCR